MERGIRDLQVANSQPLGSLVQLTSMAWAAIAIALYTAWNLALVILAILPITVFVLHLLLKRSRPLLESEYNKRSEAVMNIKTAVRTIGTVKCLSGQKFELWQYTESLNRAAEHSRLQGTITAVQTGFVHFIALAVFAQGFFYGSYLVANGANVPGDVVTVFWACLIATYALQSILPQLVSLEKGRAAAGMLQEIVSDVGNLDYLVNTVSTKIHKSFRSLGNGICLSKVSPPSAKLFLPDFSRYASATHRNQTNQSWKTSIWSFPLVLPLLLLEKVGQARVHSLVFCLVSTGIVSVSISMMKNL